jgi:hypothetical protein
MATRIMNRGAMEHHAAIEVDAQDATTTVDRDVHETANRVANQRQARR